MNIFNYFRKKGIDTVDASFYRKIDEWISWYNSNVRQFTFYKVNTGRGTSKRCRRKSMGMAKKLSEDIADLLLNERVMITLEDEMTQEFVQKVLDNNHFLVMGNDYQERKAYSGTVAYIPYLYNAVVQEDGTNLQVRLESTMWMPRTSIRSAGIMGKSRNAFLRPCTRCVRRNTCRFSFTR